MTREKWLAVRAWLRDERVMHREMCNLRTLQGMTLSAEWHAGYAIACDVALSEMSKIAKRKERQDA